MEQLTKQQALNFYKFELWRDFSSLERARFQILQEKLFMPFSVFHEDLEASLNRPIQTLELAYNHERIQAELFGNATRPVLQYFLELIPSNRRDLINY